MTKDEIIERIMTHHWDVVACRCWICIAGRELDLHPREDYLFHKSKIKVAKVPMLPWIAEVEAELSK